MLEVKGMKQQRNDLQPFDMARLNEIRKLRSEMYCGGDNKLFWDELEAIITSEGYAPSNEWERMDNDDVVLGNVWSQPIGEFYYKHTVHRFAYLYVESQGLVIGEHGHSEPIHVYESGYEITMYRQLAEWYVFPNGSMELCRKYLTHKLVNNFGKPIYVLSIKIGSNGSRTSTT